MTTEPDVFLYHHALAELAQAGRVFAMAIVNAAERGKAVEGNVDDLIAMRTCAELRTVMAEAFARAPGMIQILTDGEGK